MSMPQHFFESWSIADLTRLDAGVSSGTAV